MNRKDERIMSIKDIRFTLSNKYKNLEITKILNVIKTKDNKNMVYFSANNKEDIYHKTKVLTSII